MNKNQQILQFILTEIAPWLLVALIPIAVVCFGVLVHEFITDGEES